MLVLPVNVKRVKVFSHTGMNNSKTTVNLLLLYSGRELLNHLYTHYAKTIRPLKRQNGSRRLCRFCRVFWLAYRYCSAGIFVTLHFQCRFPGLVNLPDIMGRNASAPLFFLIFQEVRNGNSSPPSI